MLSCPKCERPFPADFASLPGLHDCPACKRLVEVKVFPALYRREAVGGAGEILVTEAESSCFFHSAKRAVTVCNNCGRFLCALCDVDLNGEHLCPTCVNTGRRKGKLKQLENRRMLYDSLALTLALAPLLVFYLTFITAPAVVYVVIRYWNAPRSVIGRGRWRMVVAMLIALIEIALWIIGIGYFATHGTTTHPVIQTRVYNTTP